MKKKLGSAMADALKAAFAKVDIAMPTAAVSQPKHLQHRRTQRSAFPARQQSNSIGAEMRGIGPPHGTIAAPEKVASVLPKPPHKLLSYKIQVSNEAQFALGNGQSRAVTLLPDVESAGRKTQICTDRYGDEREVTIGLDFGTSTVKVAVGDRVLDKAFAIRFCETGGIEQYLLPCRVYETESAYTLDAVGEAHRDLKLALLAQSSDRQQEIVVAFLGLVIRRVRGWLFTQYADVYRNTKIVWKLMIGLPAAHHLEGPLSKLFEQVGRTAWIAAENEEGPATAVPKNLRVGDVFSDDRLREVDVMVVPEIAAQIYGFVASNKFDRNRNNIFLMVDVGAGTIDAALFHVRPSRGGRWDFEFFTSVVQPNGVMNLHRNRVNWWRETLSTLDSHDELVCALNENGFATDGQVVVPESFAAYFDGIKVTFGNQSKNPDEQFYKSRVLTQVRGKAYWRAWFDKFLPQGHLSDIPVFLCGGGMRMNYYQSLAEDLLYTEGYTWLSAIWRQLSAPDNLIADGLPMVDYDRLSVAYGLSFLEVGKIVKALPLPKIAETPVDSWRDNYVDKDHC